MNEPTKEIQREFWGLCGFNWWEVAEAWCFGKDEVSRELPPITLDNLFEYAVPKLTKYRLENDWSEIEKHFAYVEIKEKSGQRMR